MLIVCYYVFFFYVREFIHTPKRTQGILDCTVHSASTSKIMLKIKDEFVKEKN